MFTPEHILQRSLCRRPHCAGPHELRDKLLKEWPIAAIALWRQQARNHIACMEFASEYAEPGYDNPKKGILFANWNYFPREAGDLLERAGYSVEWSDEWSTCDGCGKAVRISPDSYQWQPYHVETENGLHCMNCLDAEEEEVAATGEAAASPAAATIENYQTDDPMDIDPEEHYRGILATRDELLKKS